MTISLDSVDLILASTSGYRRELLSRLTPNFRCIAPEVDETPQPDEAPGALALRLACAKADHVAAQFRGALVIGSDQVADLDGRTFGKPGTVDNACAQLRACSGRQVIFHTAVCLSTFDDRGGAGRVDIDTTRVYFRSLSDGEIKRYVERELPLNCAGSFKSEGLGITLFEKIESEDPSALIGLPLIRLCRLLRKAGVEVV